MIVISLVLAPAVMALATRVERRLGPSAAGWVAALPIAFAIAVVAVELDGGPASATAMALSTGAHVPGQVLFAVVFAGALARRTLAFSVAAGTAAYVAFAAVLAAPPPALEVCSAIPLLVIAPRLIPGGPSRAGSPRRRSVTAVTWAGATVIVGAAIITTRLAGPVIAGAVVAFPTLCTTLTIAVARQDGAQAGIHALGGLVRSLPCYLSFCLVVALGTPAMGLLAIPVGLLVCLGAARATWRGVAIAPQPATSGGGS